MKNILIVILIAVVGVLAYMQFKPKETVVPSGQTTTTNNSNGDDYQPVKNTVNNTVQNTDDTVGWKTYSSTEYGFSFQYPSTWKTPTTTPIAAPIGNKLEIYAKEAIIVPFITHYTSGLTLNDFIGMAYGHSASDNPQSIQVAGQKGYKYAFETSTNGRGAPYPLYNQQVGFEDGKGGVICG